MSRLQLAKAAVRPAMKARLMLSGPPGAGKTKSALSIARTLVGPSGKILMVDTEEESALTYADEFSFTHLPWREPYDPRELGRDLLAAKGDGYDLGIVDSTTHFWNGKGGVLEIADGKYGGWKDARPAHRDLVTSFLRADMHIILCVRSKVQHAVTVDANGKQKVEKLGMGPIQDSELEYELNVTADIDLQHQLSISKTRCAPLAGKVFDAFHEREFAETYREWLKGGEPMADYAIKDKLTKRLNALPEENELRKKAKVKFLEKFGRPEYLLASDVKAAEAFVTDEEKFAKAAAAVAEKAEAVTAE